jgi:hypothetical protein
MTSAVAERPVSPVEVGVPRVLWVPATAVTSAAGDEAVELAAMAGLVLDEWQRFVLRQAMAEDARGKWAAFEVGLVVSRQNGKGSLLEARELAGLFLLGERLLIHSAHLFDTSMEHFRRVLELIESTPEFDARVKRVSRSHGDEGVELKSGQRLRFKTRTKSGGRGLTGDFVALDEAMILDDTAVGALMPTMAAKSVHGNPQIWYTGSAGNAESRVLARIRRRALAGGDPSLCYMEHSVDEAVYEADPEGVAVDPARIAEANPSLGIRISLEHALREQRSMDRVEYARERLGVGQWPPDEDDAWVIPRKLWSELADRSQSPPRPVGKVAFAVETTPSRKATSISVAGVRPDGLPQVQWWMSFGRATDAVPELARLVREHANYGVVVDMQSAAASLVDDLRAAGVDVIEMHTPDAKLAFGQWFDACMGDRLRHLAQRELTNALKGAATREVGDALLWNRRTPDVDITPLVSATNALWGWTTRSGTGELQIF